MRVKNINFHTVSKKNNPFPTSTELDGYMASQETNDCVVRAVKHAFDVEYSDAHYFCETKLKRKRFEGTFTNMYLPKVKQAFNKKIKKLGKKTDWGTIRLSRPKNTRYYDPRTGRYKRRIERVPFKVKDFVKAHPNGSYIIVVRRHAFALIDGDVRGNWDDDKRANREVISAYQVG
jgi:hypothetical protein|tara:strand:+ start:256 stop:783 length:528 start_codon:yes stop_codon:yes gene_type:complete